MAIKRGIDKAVEAAVEGLKEISSEINGKEDIARVASISANNNEIGNLIADAMEKVSKDGVITISLPSNQTAVEGTFANGLFPTIARAQALDLNFYNICGGVKFTVSRNDISSVVFKGNNDERIAGTVNVVFDGSGKPLVTEEEIDSKTEITVFAPAGGTFKVGKEYYLTKITLLKEKENISLNT